MTFTTILLLAAGVVGIIIFGALVVVTVSLLFGWKDWMDRGSH